MRSAIGTVLVGLMLCVGVLVMPGIACSQTPTASTPVRVVSAEVEAEAQREFDEGQSLASANRWRDALLHYQRACELVLSPLCLRRQVIAYHRLGESIAAARALARYDEVRVGVSHPEVEEVREPILARVGRVHLVLEGGAMPPGMTVAVDGMNVPAAHFDDPRERIVVEPGTHVIEARGAGRDSERQSVEVAAGRDLSVSVAIPRERIPITRRWWFWTGVGVLVAGAATAVVVSTTSGVGPGPSIPNGVLIPLSPRNTR